MPLLNRENVVEVAVSDVDQALAPQLLERAILQVRVERGRVEEIGVREVKGSACILLPH